ncbi:MULTISPECIES: 3'-5' exonuclease [unclassified Polaromonas]|uniref:3'-5' exonuclease n=1 Tax=unclassified Polaromonas TaxID=2638319 RepID=UPI0018C973A8|nr:MULTISPECIES: 3'-5' exonuclease [unclassified Polaromonas]MBG6073413.1 superfamily I DNA/RNA helicase/mRNA-degrading endonuclease RelE of RelBE toxin-antitoxin system [Polaromonas sp. CG_9.7]MBG6115402.1 superfamily I DNA/RNA helicase/mRNA-degrading endonuclease RelE of RelBE toxin-antitoxin system [Polaromonas sp. CG_9.2]
MDFRISDTFTESLARLTGNEQKAAKTTAFDLQLNPSQPGLSLHKLDQSKDKNFWSVRVSSGIRLIVHKTAASLLLCYVDHHDKAYQWAERRKLETHPTTGAAQFVEIRERVQEVFVSRALHVAEPSPPWAVITKPLLFAHLTDAELLGYGVPAEWLADARAVNEDSLLMLADHLPSEAGEALLELATGGTPQVRKPAAGASPFEHPDAQRRFRVVNDIEELELALSSPWEKWTTFLHPAQREWVERDYSGPARVSGSAGTGKTIVALHRAVFLARKYPDSRVLLATFSEPLASALHQKLRLLICGTPRLAERLEVQSLIGIGERLYVAKVGRLKVASQQVVAHLLAQAIAEAGASLTPALTTAFVQSEWDELIDEWQVENWDAYRDLNRLGRKTRLPEVRRAAVWAVVDKARAHLREQGLVTHAQMFTQLAKHFEEMKKPPFDFIVVDEAQDMSVAQLKFLGALGAQAGVPKPNGIFFAGDLGQRIFQLPFSWKSLGVDVRGRSRTLTINYRTSHQIRVQADRLLGPDVSDIDGNVEIRKGTVSVFNGQPPSVQVFASEAAEIAGVGAWLKECCSENVQPSEIAVFVRSAAQLDRARQAVKASGMNFCVLDNKVRPEESRVSICTMHLAKGLEFRAVVVMACDDEVVPLQSRIQNIADNADLQEVYNTERHLLYVACTRARDRLLVTAAEPASEFLDDLLGAF